MRILRLLILPLFLAAAAVSAAPPTPPTASAAELQAAAAAFSAADWSAAHNAYRALAKRYPTHALSRFRVGVTLNELGRSDEAIPNLREGERLGIPAPQSAFRLAQALAEAKQGDAAIAELRRALAAGFFTLPSALASDPHFSKLSAHAEWASVLDAFDAVVQPCKHDARFRQFDFWIGDWDVRPTGVPATGPPSRNTVTLEENTCVIMEHWAGVGGSTGQSFNLFYRSLGKWRQTWVDNTGGQHDYVGSLQDGNMVFEGTTPAPNGQLGRVATRLTFFHVGADSVRQFSQTSPDSGRTWQVAYDLMYVRRKP